LGGRWDDEDLKNAWALSFPRRFLEVQQDEAYGKLSLTPIARQQ